MYRIIPSSCCQMKCGDRLPALWDLLKVGRVMRRFAGVFIGGHTDLCILADAFCEADTLSQKSVTSTSITSPATEIASARILHSHESSHIPQYRGVLFFFIYSFPEKLPPLYSWGWMLLTVQSACIEMHWVTCGVHLEVTVAWSFGQVNVCSTWVITWVILRSYLLPLVLMFRLRGGNVFIF